MRALARRVGLGIAARGDISDVIDWTITSPDGKILQPSDSIPLSDLRQKLAWKDGSLLPSLSTQTKEYQIDWSVGPENIASHMALSSKSQADHKIMLVMISRLRLNRSARKPANGLASPYADIRDDVSRPNCASVMGNDARIDPCIVVIIIRAR